MVEKENAGSAKRFRNNINNRVSAEIAGLMWHPKFTPLKFLGKNVQSQYKNVRTVFIVVGFNYYRNQ